MHRRSRRILTAAPRPARLVAGLLTLGVGLMLLGAGAPAIAGVADAMAQSPADAAPAGSLKTQLLRRTQLRTRPGGPVVATLDRFNGVRL